MRRQPTGHRGPDLPAFPGEEFDPLLKFRLPGRRIRGAQPIDAAGNVREKLLLLPEDDVAVPAAPPAAGLGARKRISALLVLSGKPAKGQERIEQPEG
jgi:hypothetical protein